MTKKEIVRTISDEIGLTQQKTKEIVQKTFETIIEVLATEQRVELRNFGVFEVKKRAARSARNPRTSAKVEVPEKWVVTFKPGKEMKQRISEPNPAPFQESGYIPSQIPSQSSSEPEAGESYLADTFFDEPPS